MSFDALTAAEKINLFLWISINRRYGVPTEKVGVPPRVGLELDQFRFLVWVNILWLKRSAYRGTVMGTKPI